MAGCREAREPDLQREGMPVYLKSVLPGIIIVLIIGACSSTSDEAKPVASSLQTTMAVPATITSLLSTTEEQVDDKTAATQSQIICEPAPEGTTVVVALPEWELGTVRSLELRKTRSQTGK